MNRSVRPFCAFFIIVFLGKCASAQQGFTPPSSPRQMFNFNPGWKFDREDVPGAEAIGFDDSKWATVSTPHTFNETDTFNRIISHGSGQQGQYLGIAWYRKHFKLPTNFSGRKIFLEFEGLRQAGWFYLNGKQIGFYEDAVTPYGLDITSEVHFGDQENVLAVKIDNSTNYKQQSTGQTFEWESKDFNPDYGGINRDVWLHTTGQIYQTLPIYNGLQTQGVYVFGENISTAAQTADVTIEAEVKNETGDQQSINLSAVIVDHAGNIAARFDGDTSDLVSGEHEVLKATGQLVSAHFWDVNDPYLYDVYSILTVNNQVVDVFKTTTGFRKTEFRGGVGKGGVWLNDRFVYLKGYAQRSTDEWAGLGQAYPDWMHDLNAQLVRDSHANYMRWMHISPQGVDARAYDRFGIIEVAPAGDKEKDAKDAQWKQRVSVMRDSMIYLRNHPSILFWESGNNTISPEHMKEMKELKDQWDPHGGRVIGCRSLAADSAPFTEYFGVMIGQDPRTDELKDNSTLFRAYSGQRRDTAPVIETEDFRDEAARRFWDDQSPPHFGFKPGPADVYHWNSETFCLAAIARYNAYWINRISNTDPAHSKWSGYASIYFFDSNADGRQDSSEVCRVSGKMDAVRLPKQAYYAYQVMQNPSPQVHIIGHWNYPPGTRKNIYVVSNTAAVELMVNGKSLGVSDHPTDGFLFTFANVNWESGTIKAVGLNGNKPVCNDEIETAGEAKKIKLTPIVGPRGLQADGGDVVLFDVEVVDEQGRRCPTDEGRIDFAMMGPGIWRGGYNSGKIDSTNNLFLDTECGINRVAIRSTMEPGKIQLTASRNGLTPATVVVQSHAVRVADGLTDQMPQRIDFKEAK